MAGIVAASGFPPKFGDVTARYTAAVGEHLPPLLEDVRMFIYSPALRCGVFYLARIRAVLLDSIYIPASGRYPLTSCLLHHIYAIEVTCTGAPANAKSFTFDPYSDDFTVFYGPDRGVGPPGQ